MLRAHGVHRCRFFLERRVQRPLELGNIRPLGTAATVFIVKSANIHFCVLNVTQCGMAVPLKVQVPK